MPTSSISSTQSTELATHYFSCRDFAGIQANVDEHGFAIVQSVLSTELLESLKEATLRVTEAASFNEHWGSQTCMNFIEQAPEALQLLEHRPYMDLVEYLYGTDDLCFHRSACIARKQGRGVVSWHTDQCKLLPSEPSQNPNDVLNRSKSLNGMAAWFYLTGSRPSHGGIHVIEGSHKADWEVPDGFQATQCGRSFYRDGGDGEEEVSHGSFDVPGMIPVIAEPGDLILFAADTYHAAEANSEQEIRLSCAVGLRPREVHVDTPWQWPDSAHAFKKRLPEKFKRYLDGYPSIVPGWSAESA